MKRNGTERNGTKRNGTKRNETRRDETRRKKTKRDTTRRNERNERNETKRNEMKRYTHMNRYSPADQHSDHDRSPSRVKDIVCVFVSLGDPYPERCNQDVASDHEGCDPILFIY